jgi:group I intron endonuclease
MNTPNIVFIYRILNKINGKFYIGSTYSIDRRFKEHQRDLNKGKHHSIYLQRAWNKYGEPMFEFEVLGICLKQNSKKEEQFLLDSTQCYNPNIGYNMNIKVDSRKDRPMSLESRIKMSNCKKGKPSPKLGMKVSEETREKLSLSHKNQKAWNKGQKGVYSEDVKYQMGSGRRGKTAWNKGQKIGVAWNKGLTKETDERIAKMADSKEICLKRSIAVTKWWKQRKEESNAVLF